MCPGASNRAEAANRYLALCGSPSRSAKTTTNSLRKTVAKPVTELGLLSPLGLALSEKQIPQAVEKVKSRDEPKEALEGTGLRPRQASYLVLVCQLVLIRLAALDFWPFGRAKNVKEIGLSAIYGERKQAPRFDASRWNYGVVIESMKGRRLLGVQLADSTGSPLEIACVSGRPVRGNPF